MVQDSKLLHQGRSIVDAGDSFTGAGRISCSFTNVAIIFPKPVARQPWQWWIPVGATSLTVDTPYVITTEGIRGGDGKWTIPVNAINSYSVSDFINVTGGNLQ